MKETLTYSDNTNPLRVDKNIAFNISSFRTFEEDAKILKAIVLFIAINHQQADLFGFYKIDPKKFAKEMYLQTAHLFRQHPKPFFAEHDPNARTLIENEIKGGRMSRHRTWSTYFENALYILTNKSIIDDYRYKEGDKTIIATKRFNFIDEIRFELVTTGKTKKIMYYYKPNKKYVNNLKTYFLNTQIEKYNSLKKPKLDEGYLYILNRINNANVKNENAITLNIDTLASILQIKPYKRFSPYKIKVTEKFEILKKIIGQDVKGLDLTWAKPIRTLEEISNIGRDTKFVNYSNTAIISWDRATAAEKSEKDSKTYKSIFDTELNRALIQAYFHTTKAKLNIFDDENKKKAFYKWIFSNENLDIKKIKYQDTYIEVYKNTQSLNSNTDDFLKVLEYLTKIQEEYSCIKYSNDTLTFMLKEKKIRFRHLYELLNYVKGQLII